MYPKSAVFRFDKFVKFACERDLISKFSVDDISWAWALDGCVCPKSDWDELVNEQVVYVGAINGVTHKLPVECFDFVD